MAKKLKTGDVRKYEKTVRIDHGHKWVTIGEVNQAPEVWSWHTRGIARGIARLHGDKYGRVLSIGPKYVKVRISK